MNRITKILRVGCLLLLLSCYEEEQFSNVPYIEFRSLEFRDSPTFDTLALQFYFEDGDANIFTSVNDFVISYDVYVDSEPKILTEANIQDAVPPIYLAAISFENIVPRFSQGNVIVFCSDNSPDPTCPDEINTVPAFLSNEAEVFTNDVDDIIFECPNIINQRFGTTPARFDTLDIALYSFDDTTFTEYEEVFVQEINSEVPAQFRETFHNLIIQFERIVNGVPEVIDFREEFNQTDCSVGNLSGRIPFFDQDARSGTITYNINSQLLALGIGDNEFRIRFYVYDRAFNRSNEVVTPIFRLSEITR